MTKQTLNPEEIRKLPKRPDLPFNGLTRDQVIAIGGDPEEVESARVAAKARATENALRDAAELVTAAQTAVREGAMTNADAARLLLDRGQPLAHDMFLASWKETDGLIRKAEEASWLSSVDADTYTAWAEQKSEAERADLESQLVQAREDLARQQLDEMRNHLQEHFATSPWAHLDAKRLAERLEQKIIENKWVPETTEERQRLIDQAAHDISLRDDLTAQLTAQVKAEWSAKEKQRKDRNFEERKSDDRSSFQRERDEAAWKAQRLEELAQTTMIDKSDLELPLSPEEEAAKQRDRIQEKNDRSKDFALRIGEIAERTERIKDTGEENSKQRRAYAEALKRAEDQAQYGEYAAVRSGYGPNAIEADAKSGPLDEFGSAFPGYE